MINDITADDNIADDVKADDVTTNNDDTENDYSANHYAKNDYYSSDQDDPTPELVSLLPPKNQTMKSENLVLIGFGLYLFNLEFPAKTGLCIEPNKF